MEIIGILVLFIVGIYFTFKLKFLNFNLKLIIKSLFKNESNEGITPFQTLCISLASRIGVGSLSGVILALYVGGLGSIFWIWISTLLCSSNTLVESILSIKYRKSIGNNMYEGGPFYYIKMGLNKKYLSFLYALIFLFAYTCGFLTIQSNTISKIVTEIVPINPIVIGIIIVVLTSLIIFKGIKEIAGVVSKLVPFMAILYMATCLLIIFKNLDLVSNIFIKIITSAFNMKSFFTGFIIGCTKSIFSTEAGLGTGAIASSASSSTDEVSQGLIQVFGIFFDTFIVSTLTIFVVLSSPYELLNFSNINGIEITRYAFTYHIGTYGGLILIVSLILFAFSTIIGGYYYGEIALKYITQKENTTIFKIIILILLLISTIISPTIIWDLIDKFIVILALINTYSLILLRKEVFKIVKKYDKINKK